MAGKERERESLPVPVAFTVWRQKGDNESYWHRHALSLSNQKLTVMAFATAPFIMVSHDWAQSTN